MAEGWTAPDRLAIQNGNAGGLLAPVLTPLISQHFGWQAGLGLACGVCLVGAVLWFWVDASGRPQQG